MTAVHLSFPDYVVVIGYFVIVVWIGLYFRNQIVAAKDYFAGGHQIPWWLAGISHYMSSFSAFAFVAYAQLGYTYGWVAVTLFWASAFACMLGGLFFARRWRRARVITPVEFLERRFNAFVRQLFAWAGIPMKIFDDALKIFATGLFVSLSMGLSLHWSIILCGVVMIVYTFYGGLWALVVTDYVQFIMKGLAMLLLLPLAIAGAGGMSRAFSSLPPELFHLTNGPYTWIYIAGFFVLIGISYNASWALAQKYYSVRNEKEASKAAYCAAALNFLGAPLLILPAVIGRHFLPDLVAQNRTADVYVLLVLKLLPVGMIGIIVAAMFSATMAVVSSDYNAIASVLTKDVYQRLINPKAAEMRLLWMGRWITLGLGALTILLSLWIAVSHQQSLFNTMVTVLGLFMAPTLLPLLAGLTVRKLNWQGAFGGFLCGLLTGFLMLALKTWWLPAQPGGGSQEALYNFEGASLLVNAAMTVVGMVAGTMLTSRKAEAETRVNEFFVALDRPVAASEVPPSGKSGALPVIGASTFGVGILLTAAGLLSNVLTARVIDSAFGVFLLAIGVLFLRNHRKSQS
ncbi:MAG: sodium/solute symporter [Bryobacteraceae bacterium]